MGIDRIVAQSGEAIARTIQAHIGELVMVTGSTVNKGAPALFTAKKVSSEPGRRIKDTQYPDSVTISALNGVSTLSKEGLWLPDTSYSWGRSFFTDYGSVVVGLPDIVRELRAKHNYFGRLPIESGS